MNTTLKIIEIRHINTTNTVGRSRVSITEKAGRQAWPYEEIKGGVGRPLKLYPLATLPPDIQMAWASWDESKRQEAIKEEQRKKESGGRGFPDRVLPAITAEEAKEALAWPIRTTFYRKEHPGGKGKVYDGHSVGLCPEARQILMERFGEELGTIPEAGSIPPEALRLPERGEPVKPSSQPNNPAPKARMSKELQTENKLLKELLEAKEQIIQQGQEMLRMKEAEIGRLAEVNKRLEAELEKEKQETARMEETICVD